FKVFVFISSFFLLLFQLFLFLNHIDYFIYKKQSTARIKQIQVVNRNEFLSVEFFNEYLNKNQEFTISVPVGIGKEFIDTKESKIDIVYTKWFKQALIKSYKNPRIPIFILDIVVIVLMIYGIRYSIDNKE
ncbi:hypothetical protein, partial [Thermococcus sp. M36]|uniref:hypothetical protein n=1 Tax=Thermococcus sp. M36 TaxID=1638261 RepID=UPI00197EEFEE